MAFVDNEQVEAVKAAYIYDLPPGDHQLRIEGTSQMGKIAIQEVVVPVVPNKMPECVINQSLLDSAVRPQYVFQAVCTDNDGFMTGYRWYIGEKIVGYGAKVGFKVPTEGSQVVDFIGTDNTGGKFHKSITLLPKSVEPPPEG